MVHESRHSTVRTAGLTSRAAHLRVEVGALWVDELCQAHHDVVPIALLAERALCLHVKGHRKESIEECAQEVVLVALQEQLVHEGIERTQHLPPILDAQ